MVKNKTSEIGLRIKELRTKKNLSQAKLAKLVGCAQNTVAEWEKRENRSPGKSLLNKVADILDVSTDYLLKGQADTPEIPYYGEVQSEKFGWNLMRKEKSYLFVSEKYYEQGLFSLKIVDDLLEPTICKNDFAILKKELPKDGDIVLVRFLKASFAIIRLWRQKDNLVTLTETKLSKICEPYFLQVEKYNTNSVVCKIENNDVVISEGVVIFVKKVTNPHSISKRIQHIE